MEKQEKIELDGLPLLIQVLEKRLAGYKERYQELQTKFAG